LPRDLSFPASLARFEMIGPMRAIRMALVAASIAWSMPAQADFSSCKESLKAEGLRNGISEGTIAAALGGVTPDPKILDLEKSQPEFKTPIWDYLAALVDDERVRDGKAAMASQAKALALAEQRFGVSKYVVAAIWGVESDFGREMGGRSLVQSLATLACIGSRRPNYFRAELMATLKIADRGDIPLEKLKGSWAGAFGQTQFMPTTYLRLAVDLNGTGRDIIDNPAAALGSTANYLKKSGWTPGETWGFEVKLPADYDGPLGRKNRRPMSFWASRGVKRIDGEALGSGTGGLFLPAGKNGPAFLVTHNFDVIYSYNAAESYALAAVILAQRLAGGPGIVVSWPTNDPGISRANRRELQKLLEQRGYDVGAPDGAIGAKTRSAIADFQQKVGLEVNGRASQKVLDRLRQ
jgi:lytic murein transglycosylase